jgi:hypothetical protein
VEQPHQQAGERPDGTVDRTGLPETSGHPDVDAVIESLGQLDDLPVAEHVAVFESAHTELRRVLGRGEDR